MPSFPLAADDLAAAEFRKEPIERLIALIDGHVAEGRYPGCQIALARGGRLVLERAFGAARPAGPRAQFRRRTPRAGAQGGDQ